MHDRDKMQHINQGDSRVGEFFHMIPFQWLELFILKGMQNNGIQYSILLSSPDSRTSGFVNAKLTATGNEFNLIFLQ